MSDTTNRPVRTRFAPSPTGPLHIGGVRTALFGWLFARHHGGQFILRIEDTDQKRYVPGSVDMILDALDWLGMDIDEGPHIGGAYGPYVQSERLEHYHQWADWLLENDKAYKCFCTPQRLKQVNEDKKKRKESPGYDRHCRYLSPEERAQREAEGQPYVIRFKMPLEGKTVVHDLVRGEVEWDNTVIQDAVLMKSDGFPTYHLAHIVDDYLMQITHVTRANEWLSSLPLHVHIWEAFGWEMPQFAHLPILLNPNGEGKLSKRSQSFDADGKKVFVLAKEYKDAGYLPEAMMNFLINIGWNFGDEREVFTVEEAIARFDLTEVNPANSAYPIEKLDWLNGLYIREYLSTEELANRLRKPLEDAGLAVDEDRLLKVAPLVRTRITTLSDVVEMAGFFFHDVFKPAEPDMLIQKKMDATSTLAVLEASHRLIKSLEDFSHDSQHEAFKALAKELGLKNGQVFGTVRVAITGQRVSTPTFETMEILGKDEALQRIQLAVESLSQKA